MIVFIENVFHKCGICELPLISNVIVARLYLHKITHKEYNHKYVVEYVVKWSSICTCTRSPTRRMILVIVTGSYLKC